MNNATGRETGSLAALEAFGSSAGTLWARIAPGGPPGGLRKILFVGSEHGSGTSTAACCAAAGLARNLQARVMLVEIGFGASTLAGLLGLPDGPGFHELLCNGATLQECARSCGLEGLSVVTAGRGSLPPGRLASEQARVLFEKLSAGVEFLLIDSPPIQAHPELQPILRHVNEALLVLEAEHTQREQARNLLEIVGRAGVRVLGSVLTHARESGSR